MQVILLERVAKLGQMGEVVKVKEGFARNYLLPQGKAMRANDANIAAFEARKADLATRNDETRAEAQKVAERVWTARASSSSARHRTPARCMARSRRATWRKPRLPKATPSSVARSS